jgi:hypothetical protein
MRGAVSALPSRDDDRTFRLTLQAVKYELPAAGQRLPRYRRVLNILAENPAACYRAAYPHTSQVRTPAVAAFTFPEVTAKLSTTEYVPVSCGGIGRADQKLASPLDTMSGTSAPVIS